MDTKLIPAERIVSLGFAVRRGELPEISRSLDMVENRLLLEIAEVVHNDNIFRVFSMASTSGTGRTSIASDNQDTSS